MLSESELYPHQVQTMNEILGNLKRQPYSDPKIQSLSENFLRAAFLMDEREQDTCTRLFIENVVGVDIPNPWDTDYKWLEEVGKRLNKAENEVPYNGLAFWKKVRQSVPDFLSDEDLAVLKKKDRTGHGGLQMVHYFSWYGSSPIAGQVDTYIHAWK